MFKVTVNKESVTSDLTEDIFEDMAVRKRRDSSQ